MNVLTVTAKEAYQRTQLTVICFDEEDVIMTSTPDDDPNMPKIIVEND